MTTSRPNIVVIQADQMAAQALGAYGDEAALTPNIDALAEAGAVYDRAYCNTPLCSPSRASMMTGRLPSELGCFDNGDDFASSTPTFAHHLRAAGYHTALVGRMHFIGPDQHHGFEERLTTDVYPADLDMVPDWGKPLDERLQWYHGTDSVFTAGVSHASVQKDFDDEVGFRALRHLDDRVRAAQARRAEGEEPQPFLMVASFIHPHDPYEPPRENWDRFDGVDIPDPAHPEVPSREADPHTHRLREMSGFDRKDPGIDEVRRARRAYYAAVNYIDDHIGRIRARIDALGLADDTVIIVTSDHGDMLGEKGLWYKMSPYEESSRVPMIISGPGDLVPQGRYSSTVSLIDLLPTLLELSESPAVDDGGRSLLATAREEAAEDAATGVDAEAPAERDVLIEYLAEGTYRPQVTIVRGSLKLTVCPGDPDLLFDLDADPHELRSRADDPDYAEPLASLRAELDRRYDWSDLERTVLESQERRRLVASALQRGRMEHWDIAPVDRERYVRGDFWSALQYGTIVDTER